VDQERRFGGISRLYGVDGAQRLRQANVCVVGIGGVGSWVVEALARTGVGRIVMIDLDMVAESNTNRQIHALDDVYGQAKVDAMADRVRAINPNCETSCIEDFVTPENVALLLNQGFTVVIDAIDQVRSKAAMIAFCRQQTPHHRHRCSRRANRSHPDSYNRFDSNRSRPFTGEGSLLAAQRIWLPS
jgi:tRNA A37 threonylcarbamoyladenosine dehydratase